MIGPRHPVKRELVETILAELADGASRLEVSVRHGISKDTVRNIALGRTRGVEAPSEAAERWVPACMDAAERELWLSANRSLTLQSDQATRPCEDCALDFALEMRAAGRCNGTPGEPAEAVA